MIKLSHSMLVNAGADNPTVDDVKEALQRALELEHSTIPLYLYAMYSLDPRSNGNIVRILRSAVVEEMLHMCLVANVLNALGGAPDLSAPTFVPRYPGHLPGGVEGQLMVHLRPFSRDQLNVFIEIEEPRDPLAELAQFSPGEIGECTIGEFYLSIEDAIDSLPDSAFVGDPSLQVGPELMWGSIAVTGKATADAAIDTIIEQGEGTKTSPEEIGATDDESGFAHYYRFMQVFEGRRLVKALDGDTEHFVFEGEEIDFDVAGVYPLPEDPVASNYAEGTPERMAIDECNLTYNRLLDCLHFLFNGGANSETFGVALGLMRTLEHQAKVLVTTETANGVALAPTFEYAAIE